MAYVIDRIENGLAICECIETGERFDVEMRSLPKGAQEGVVINRDGERFSIDPDATMQRKVELSDRLNRLFIKNKS